MNFEQIKNRMAENASKKWGDGKINDNASFDPLVNLLFGAFASEIESISHEINETQTRVADKLIDLMNPEINSGVVPAHALVKSVPVDDSVYVKDTVQFFSRLNTSQDLDNAEDFNKELFFLPAGKFKLVKGNIDYLIYGNKFVDNISKEVITGKNTGLSHNELWLGINISGDIRELKDINIYFEQKKNSLYLFYHYLRQSKWYHNGMPLGMASGFKQDFSSKTFFKNVLNGKSNVYNERIQHIQNFYERNFITIESIPEGMETKTGRPEIFNKTFGSDVLENLETETLWLQIYFPESFNAGMFESLECDLNVFPIVNLKRNLKIFKTKEHLNLLPLNEDDFFFDINSVEDSQGNVFSESVSDSKSTLDNNTYILRSDGVESFDNRRTSELITHLLQKLNSENATFNYIHSATFKDDLTSVNQIISKLEMQLEQQIDHKSRVYLFLKPTNDNENIYIDYWITQGKIANKMNMTSKLELHETSPYMPKSLSLITPVRGGKDKKNRIERLYTYRKSLLSNDKIVTPEDMKAFCHQYFGDIAIQVEVKRGLKNELSAKSGYTRVIDVHITTETDIFSEEEKMFHGFSILKMIEQKASNVFPYRIFINNLLIEDY